MKDAEGKSRGFGFVCFEKSDEAAKAVEDISKDQDAEKPDDKKLYVRRALKKYEREQEVRQASLNSKIANARSMLHVRSFPEDTKMEDLKAFFEKFGEIKSMSQNKTDKGGEKSFAIILNFKSTDSAKRAKAEIEGGLKYNNEIQLKVEQFQPKELREQKLQEDYYQRQVKKKIQEQLAIQMSFAYMPFLGMPSMDMFGGGGQFTPGGARYQQQQYYNQRPGMPGPPHYPQRGMRPQGGAPMNKAPYVKNQGAMGGQRPQGPPYNNQYQKPNQPPMMMPGQNPGYPQGMPQQNQQVPPQQYPPRQPVGLSPQSIQHQQQKQEPQVSDFYQRIQFYANQIFQSTEYANATEDEKKNQLGELYYEIAKSRVDDE